MIREAIWSGEMHPCLGSWVGSGEPGLVQMESSGVGATWNQSPQQGWKWSYVIAIK